jgi:monoterpene epsilon-lactone hydrolase
MLSKKSKLPSWATRAVFLLLACSAAPTYLVAQQALLQAAPTSDTTTIDADGTAHITRVIPVPRTVSPEAQARLAKGLAWAMNPTDPETDQLIAKAHELYPGTDEAQTIAGIPVRIFKPATASAAKKDRILINLHGGGFGVDANSFLESIPIANLTGTEVISVYYRLASVAPFPAAVDDVVAVYKEVLRTHKPAKIAIYGTSAGAILTGQVAVRLKHDGLPEPGALGFFTGHADFTRTGDSQSFYAVPGLVGSRPPQPEAGRPYMKGADPSSPLASPIFADLKGLPPTLCVTGTRDLFLSATSTFHRALLRAGVESDLVVFDSMPHAFWFEIGTPESKEALDMMADFFNRHLGGK